MIPEWNVHALYLVGDLVELDGAVYRCIKHHNSAEDRKPGENSEYWFKEGTP